MKKISYIICFSVLMIGLVIINPFDSQALKAKEEVIHAKLSAPFTKNILILESSPINHTKHDFSIDILTGSYLINDHYTTDQVKNYFKMYAILYGDNQKEYEKQIKEQKDTNLANPPDFFVENITKQVKIKDIDADYKQVVIYLEETSNYHVLEQITFHKDNIIYSLNYSHLSDNKDINSDKLVKFLNKNLKEI